MLNRVWEHGCSQALAGAATLLVACTVATRALAQSQGDTIDTARGPISGSTRFIGLGGAFVAIADDTEGVAINPASVAVRLPYSWSQWDYGLGVDFAVGAWLPKNDLYNQAGTDDVSDSSALFGSLAAIVYFSHAGIGLSAEAQSNAATREDQEQGIAPTDLAANFGIVHASLGYGFLDGQLLLGAGPRLVGMSFDGDGSGSGSGPLSTAGVGYEAGVIFKPEVQQYRLAVAVKSPIDASVGTGSATTHVPWEVKLGVAYQLGARPLNPPFVTARKYARQAASGLEPSKAELEQAEDELLERYERLQHRYLLISAELSVIEGDGDHVGLERYWTEDSEASASRPILAPRLGLETEVIKHHLKLRGGTYYEPARVARAPARVHGTGGFDVRLFRWSVFGLIEPFDYWQLSVAADVARSYLNTSFSIGFWH